MTSCQDLPSERWGRLLAMRGQLLSDRFAPYSPEEVIRFEEDFAHLGVRYSSASNQFSFLRSPSLFYELDQSEEWADLLLRHISRRKLFLWKSQKDELETVAGQLSMIRSRQLKKDAREVLTLAEVQLNAAREIWRRGDFIDAENRIESLLETYSVLEEKLDLADRRFRDPVLMEMWHEWFDRSVRRSVKEGIDTLVVVKADYRAILYRHGVPIREFPVELGWNWIDDKKMQGDGATPEGEYRVVLKKGRGRTKYHRALLLDYPNARDRKLFKLAKESGEIDPGVGIGALIEIHGDGGTGQNWTDGCVALSNADMEDLFQLAKPGMPVTIVGAISR
ncbi:MAG: L,D-transpeptidase [Acidobacteriota bacterium]|nr:MAG: L,D-transpeptidase [Acidobacteriota bacterium]